MKFMHTILKKTALLVAVFGLIAVPALVLAEPALAIDSQKVACEGIGLAGGECTGSGATDKVNGVVKSIVDVLSWIVGIAAIVMIIIAGFRYTTSGGDSNGVAAAKGALIWAIVGIVVVSLAQFIVRFVLQQLDV